MKDIYTDAYVSFLNCIEIELSNRGWTKQDLADALGTTATTIQNVFNGKASSETLVAIKKELRISKNWKVLGYHSKNKRVAIEDRYLYPLQNISIGDEVLIKLRVDYQDTLGNYILGDDNGVYDIKFAENELRTLKPVSNQKVVDELNKKLKELGSFWKVIEHYITLFKTQKLKMKDEEFEEYLILLTNLFQFSYMSE